MPSIDERVVSMAFENRVFEQRVSATMATLGKLDTALKNVGGVSGLDKIESQANKVTLQAPMSALDKLKSKFSFGEAKAAFSGLESESQKVSFSGVTTALDKVNSKLAFPEAKTAFAELNAADQKVNFSGVSGAIDQITAKFGAVQVAGVAAFSTIASQATMRLSSVLDEVTGIRTVMEGFSDYQLKIGATQTLMSGTGAGIGEVTKELKELDIYADKTIYSLSDMTSNIGKFTNAGVELPVAVNALKGISNVAALSGASTEEAARSMYNLGQAIGSGTVRLMDWRSVELANMGTKEFKEELINSALAMGTLKKDTDGTVRSLKGTEVTYKTFGATLQDQWLTSEALTKTLNKYADENTNLGKKAYKAAMDVKTFSMMMTTLGAAAGTGWTDTFDIIIGNLPEATELWTGITNAVGGFIGKTADARNEILETWKELGGREDLIEGFKAAFQALGDVIKPISDAFRQIFPRTTGKELADMTKSFREFAESLKIDPQTADNIRRTFAGIFAVFDIAKRIVGGVIGVILDLLGVVGKGSGGFLAFTGGIGDFLVAIDEALAKGEAFKGFFDAIGAVLTVPLELLLALAGAIANVFGADNADAGKDFETTMDGLSKKLGPLKDIIDKVVEGWEAMVDALDRVKTAIEPWLSEMAEKLQGAGDILVQAFEGLDYDKILQGLETGFVGGIFLVLKKAFADGMPSIFGDSVAGVNDVMVGLTKNLEAMQNKLNAQALLALAGAIALLAGSVFLLSKINGEDLSKSMTAIAVGLGQLMGAMKLMSGGMGKTGVLMLPIIATAMVGLATAVLILSGAVKIFSTMSWEEIGKGLTGVGGAIAAIGLGMKLMPGGPFLALQAAGLILIGVALNVIAVAMQQFGSMKLEQVALGVFAMVEALGGIALGVSLMPPTLPLTAAGLILMGIALAAIGGAIRSMGTMDVATIVKGLATIMAAIAGIGLAMSLVPPHIGLTAVGLLIIGQAMVVTAGAIALLGSLSVGTLVKGLIGLAGALIIMAGGLTLMIATLPGAVALMAAAAALAVLAPVLAFLGTLEWSTIFKGLAAIGLAMVTIGVAGLIAAPALTAIGIALIPLGLGLMLVAGAAKIFAGALAIMSKEGQAGIAVLLTAITGFVAMIPTLIIGFVKGLLSIVDQITVITPKIVQAVYSIFEIIIKFITENAPKLAVAMGMLVDTMVIVLVENIPKIIDAGIKLLNALLDGLSRNVNQITDKVSDVIVKFLEAITRNLPKIIDAGVKTLRAWLEGISDHFGELSTTVDQMLEKFALAVADHGSRMATLGGKMMLQFVEGVTEQIPALVGKGKDFILSFVRGISENIDEVVKEGGKIIVKFIQGIGDNMVEITNEGADAVISFLNGMEDTIRTKGPELREAGWGVADALLDGIWAGIDDLGWKITEKLGKFVKLLPKAAKKLLGIRSPSQVFMEIGKFITLGLSKGLEDSEGEAVKSSAKVGNTVIDAFKSVFDIRSPSEVMREIGMQVNRGFADGLRGSEEDVIGAFQSLNDKLRDTIRSTKDQIAQGNKTVEDLQQQHADKLAEIARLKAEKKPDKEEIAAAVKEAGELQKQITAESKAIEANELILLRNRNARKALTTTMTGEKNQLLALKVEYEDISKKLDKATNELEEATRARNDAQKQYTDQYSATPDIGEVGEDKTPAQVLADYKKALADRVTATKSYAATLQKLRAAGLEDTTYKKLVDEGLKGKDFAEALLAGGKAGITAINALDTQLLAESTKLAQNAATELYQAGVNAAQDLVNGLTSRKAELESAMEILASSLIKALKRRLKIKSPSKEFMNIAKLSIQGLTKGFSNSTTSAVSAAERVGKEALTALKSSLSTAVFDNLDAQPVITPVLDLSQVQKEATKLGDLTNVTPISAAASYGQATAISTEKTAVDVAQADRVAQVGPTFHYEQNNYSPEALSDVEIYRRTRNQLSQVKTGLGLAS